MLVINKRDFVKRKIVKETFGVIGGFVLILLGLVAVAYGISSDGVFQPWMLIILGTILFLFGGIVLMNRAGEIAIWRAGLAGQKVVPKTLEKISDDFTLLNNISLKGRNCDIDHIVVGKSAIFAIESKHYNGEIYGQGEEWSYLKRGRAGGFYRGHIGNPARQIKRSTWELKEVIDESVAENTDGLWIEPVVVFTHPNTTLRITDSPIKVLHSNDLSEFIISRDSEKETIPGELKNQIIDLLKNQ